MDIALDCELLALESLLAGKENSLGLIAYEKVITLDDIKPYFDTRLLSRKIKKFTKGNFLFCIDYDGEIKYVVQVKEFVILLLSENQIARASIVF